MICPGRDDLSDVLAVVIVPQLLWSTSPGLLWCSNPYYPTDCCNSSENRVWTLKLELFRGTDDEWVMPHGDSFYVLQLTIYFFIAYFLTLNICYKLQYIFLCLICCLILNKYFVFTSAFLFCVKLSAFGNYWHWNKPHYKNLGELGLNNKEPAACWKLS